MVLQLSPFVLSGFIETDYRLMRDLKFLRRVQPCRWRQHGPPKRLVCNHHTTRCNKPEDHGFIFTAVKTSDLAPFMKYC